VENCTKSLGRGMKMDVEIRGLVVILSQDTLTTVSGSMIDRSGGKDECDLI
jgi:hypothetical protein